MNLKKLKVSDLKKMAEERHIKNANKLKKDELIESIQGLEEVASENEELINSLDFEIEEEKAKSTQKKATKKKEAVVEEPVEEEAEPIEEDKVEIEEVIEPVEEEVKVEIEEVEPEEEIEEEVEPVKAKKVEKEEKAKKNKPKKANKGEINYTLTSDQDEIVEGILELLPDGYGFLRGDNYLSTNSDVYVSPIQIKRFHLDTGDKIKGIKRKPSESDKFPALIYVGEVNGKHPEYAMKRKNFEDLIPIYPDKKLKLETESTKFAMRLMDLISPIGKGQRGLIVAPPKAGKTTLMKQIANSITENNPEVELIVLLIDERPEEVTDIKRSVQGDVIYSTFDEQPDHHVKVAEMVLERAKRLTEQGSDVVILLDSITRLARAYNLVIPSSGKTLSGGFDPSALYKPKRFFGAARNTEDAGSLTILATALVETGSRMDEVIFEEFKGTGNMEVKLDRSLAERRIFPAIDINSSGTRREDLLLSPEELQAIFGIRRYLNTVGAQEMNQKLMDLLTKTKNNAEFIKMMQDEIFNK